METPLPAAERKALKARAHSLHPILQLGEKGLTDAVVAEIERALGAHELVKIRAAPFNREERDVVLASICERTGAQPVQHIGKILVVYRQKPPAESKPAPRRRTQSSSGWDERKDARDKRPRRRKSRAAQPPQRRRPRA